MNRGPALAEEEAARRRRPPDALLPASGVLGQHLGQVLADRDQPGLEELGVADGEQGVRQVHVRDGQVQRLAGAQPGPVQQQQDRPQGGRFDAACGSAGTTGSRPATGGVSSRE